MAKSGIYAFGVIYQTKVVYVYQDKIGHVEKGKISIWIRLSIFRVAGCFMNKRIGFMFNILVAIFTAIIMNDRLTDDQKRELIDKEQNKITEKNKFLETQVQKYMRSGKEMPKSFMERNGITMKKPEDEREIG